MKTTDLKSLPDHELSRLFALEIAKWTYRKPYPFSTHPIWHDLRGALPEGDGFTSDDVEPTFASSVDAVLPYIDPSLVVHTGTYDGKAWCDVATKTWWENNAAMVEAGDDLEFSTRGKFLARCLCEALLLAERAKHEASPKS
jgi:hypothetical protein